MKPFSAGAALSLADITFSSVENVEMNTSKARAEIDSLNERIKQLEDSLSKPTDESFAPDITSSPNRVADEEEFTLDEAGQDLNLSTTSSTHNEEEKDGDSEQELEHSHHSSFDSEATDTDRESPDLHDPSLAQRASGSGMAPPPLSPSPSPPFPASQQFDLALPTPGIVVPEKLKGLVEIVPATPGPSDLDLDWRVAEDKKVRSELDDNGDKWWLFLKGQGEVCIKVRQEALIEKTVSGKTLLALRKDLRSWDTLQAAFGLLKQPTDEPFWEALKRKDRTKKMMDFLRTANNSCAKAVGDWEASDEDAEVVVSKLPGDLKAIAERKRPARPASPPVAFSFRGKEGSEAENFLQAVYAKPGQLEESMSWGQYLNQDRLFTPPTFKVLEKIQKELAQLVRPLQCTLAVADIADNIGGANLKDSISKEALKELVQVIGSLSREAAVALLPLADHKAALFAKEKTDLRKVAYNRIRPPSIQMDLEKTPIFSPGLFPKKELKEIEQRAQSTDASNDFPALKGSFKRPLPSPTNALFAPPRKRTCPLSNAMPPRTTPPTKQLATDRRTKFPFKKTSSHNGSGQNGRNPGYSGKAPKQQYHKPGNHKAGNDKQIRHTPNPKPSTQAKPAPKSAAGPK